MRYRASGWGYEKEGCDKYQTRITFENRPDGTLQMKGVFVYESQPRTFTAVKIKDAPPAPPAPPAPHEYLAGTMATTFWNNDKPKGQRKSQTIIV
jgi:hypothetical protein